MKLTKVHEWVEQKLKTKPFLFIFFLFFQPLSRLLSNSTGAKLTFKYCEEVNSTDAILIHHSLTVKAKLISKLVSRPLLQPSHSSSCLLIK